MTEFGIWSEEAGGFILTQIYSHDEGVKELTSMDSETDTLTVIEICPDHQEQPKDGCEECET